MKYIIEYLESVAKEDIPHLPKRAKALIHASIEKRLTSEPDLYGAPLRRSLKGLRKLRVSEYRVIFQIKGSKVTVIMIGHRSKVYEEILHRLKKR